MTAEAEALEPQDDIDPIDPPAGDEEGPGDGPSAEEKATRTGWKPLDQFKGDPAKWVDAETFVKRAEEDPAIIRATNKQLEKALEQANKRFDSRVGHLEKTLKDFAEHHTKTQQRAYEAAVRDLKAQQAQAVADNDVQAVDEITDKLTDLKAEAKAPTPKAAGPTQEEVDAFRAQFAAENKWFGTDQDMTDFAGGLPIPATMSLEEQGHFIAERVKKAFPHKFENPNRRTAPAVEGVGTARKAAGKTFADLPADAQAMCAQFERDIKGFTRAQYVKDYFA